jgi:hypothetical protein
MLMDKWSIDQIQVDASKAAGDRRKPTKITIDICGPKNPARPYLVTIVTRIADYCRCSVLFYNYDRLNVECSAVVYGYQSDLAFFEILFTTVYLHLGSGLSPKWETEKPEQENIVRLHHMGLNWLDIARIKPDVMWDGNQATASKAGSAVKRVYYKWAKETGVKPLISGNRIQWIKSFAEGYKSRLSGRLYELENKREAGTALVLRNSKEDIDRYLKELYPDTKSFRLRASHKHNQEAYSAGDQHAREADLSGGRGGVSRGVRGEIG